MLSILIPVYNTVCARLVKELHRQCVQNGIEFEIIALDDQSDKFVAQNNAINCYSHCRYVVGNEKYGRARIRNELGKLAQFEYLLFIDADALVDSPDFIQTYLENKEKAEVLVGGMKYSIEAPKKEALRWFYGKNREDIPAIKRNQHPYRSIISFNIFVRREIFIKYPFDEAVIHHKKSAYGHEDTLLGLRYKQNKISILHLDNALIHQYVETDNAFLKNACIAVEKYVNNPLFSSKEVVENIKIFRVFNKVKKFRCTYLFNLFYCCFRGLMRKNLLSKHPSLFVFDLYRLTYLSYYFNRSKQIDVQ